MAENRGALEAAARLRREAALNRAERLDVPPTAMRSATPGLTQAEPFTERVARLATFPGRLEARKTVEKNGAKYRELFGHASVTETPYEMYDFFGPYQEVVDREAFDPTLGREPDVAFLVNHRGLTMARSITRNGGEPTLMLGADEDGLASTAWVNPARSDVNDLLLAIEDGQITEMSFAFMIVRGKWSPDYSEFRILEVDLDRGDVSAVNYGANPYTDIAARAQEVMTDFQHLPPSAQQAAARRAGLETREVQRMLEDKTDDLAAAKEAPQVEPAKPHGPVVDVRGDAEPEQVAAAVRAAVTPPAAPTPAQDRVPVEAQRTVTGMSTELARARASVLFGED